MLSIHETVAINSSASGRGEENIWARRQAIRIHRQTVSRGLRRRLRQWLSGRHDRLQTLEANGRALGARRYIGMELVPIAAIRGSESRNSDFDIEFYPLAMHNDERWINVATAHFLDIPLPPVQLIQIGEVYYVRDGHHRISVAQAFGQKEIEAEVFAWETGAE